MNLQVVIDKIVRARDGLTKVVTGSPDYLSAAARYCRQFADACDAVAEYEKVAFGAEGGQPTVAAAPKQATAEEAAKLEEVHAYAYGIAHAGSPRGLMAAMQEDEGGGPRKGRSLGALLSNPMIRTFLAQALQELVGQVLAKLDSKTSG